MDSDAKITVPSESPFSVNFDWNGQRVTVRLVNGDDVLKLADVLADMLRAHSIEFTVERTGGEAK